MPVNRWNSIHSRRYGPSLRTRAHAATVGKRVALEPPQSCCRALDASYGCGGASQAAVPPSSLDTGISLTNAAARMIAMTSAMRSQVRNRRHQFSIREPCSRAIIAARAYWRARSAAGAGAISLAATKWCENRWCAARRRHWRLPRATLSCLGGNSIGVRRSLNQNHGSLVCYMPLAHRRRPRRRAKHPARVTLSTRKHTPAAVWTNRCRRPRVSRRRRPSIDTSEIVTQRRGDARRRPWDPWEGRSAAAHASEQSRSERHGRRPQNK